METLSARTRSMRALFAKTKTMFEAMDEAAIIRAIVDAGYDEHLLREYACWLIARGDHRGEHLQLEMERRVKESSLLELEDKLAHMAIFKPVDPMWFNEVLPLTIHSPMVGTFYASRSPLSPQAEPYVTVGQILNLHSIVGIIAAMHVFNEIPAGTSGVVKEILVHDGAPVEYGQPLLRLERLPRLVGGG